MHFKVCFVLFSFLPLWESMSERASSNMLLLFCSLPVFFIVSSLLHTMLWLWFVLWYLIKWLTLISKSHKLHVVTGTKCDTGLSVWLEDPKAVPNMRPVLKLWLFLMEDLILSFQDCSCGWDYTICWCFRCQEFPFERVNSWALPEGSH